MLIVTHSGKKKTQIKVVYTSSAALLNFLDKICRSYKSTQYILVTFTQLKSTASSATKLST